jgi:oxysterol-binding protein 1
MNGGSNFVTLSKTLLIHPFYYLDGSGSEYSDEQDRNDDNSDDENDAFFDTYEILTTSSIRSHGSSDHLKSNHESESEETSTPTIGSNYPHIDRRKKLPDPVGKETGISLWSIIKDNIGKDLTKVCLPVYFNEPISSLQKCFEDLEYSHLLDQAYECGKKVSFQYLKNIYSAIVKI